MFPSPSVMCFHAVPSNLPGSALKHLCHLLPSRDRTTGLTFRRNDHQVKMTPKQEFPRAPQTQDPGPSAKFSTTWDLLVLFVGRISSASRRTFLWTLRWERWHGPDSISSMEFNGNYQLEQLGWRRRTGTMKEPEHQGFVFLMLNSARLISVKDTYLEGALHPSPVVPQVILTTHTSLNSIFRVNRESSSSANMRKSRKFK